MSIPAIILASAVATNPTTTEVDPESAVFDANFEFKSLPAVIAAAPQSEEPSEVTTTAAAAPFGTAGAWRWNIQGGGGSDFDEIDFAFGGVSVSYFASDKISIELEYNGMYYSQEGFADAYGLNFNLLFRWHFLQRENWSLYVDGGAGLLATNENVPHNGSSFNFTPQAGVGITYEIADNVRMFTGARWHHVSNSGSFENNPGLDELQMYAGVSFPF